MPATTISAIASEPILGKGAITATATLSPKAHKRRQPLMASDSFLGLPPYSTPVWLETRGIFCKRTWWRWVAARKVKCIRPMGKILIPRAEVERVLSCYPLERKEPEPDPMRVLAGLKKKARSRIAAERCMQVSQEDRCLPAEDQEPAFGQSAGSGSRCE